MMKKIIIVYIGDWEVISVYANSKSDIIEVERSILNIDFE